MITSCRILLLIVTILKLVYSLEITILGATGKTGKEFVPKALAAGHNVRALVRNLVSATELFAPNMNEKGKLTFIEGDISSDDSIFDTLVKGADIVICALGAHRNHVSEKPVAIGTKSVVKSMKKFGVRKYIAISTAGTVVKFLPTPLMTYAFYFFLNHIEDDHKDNEAFLAANSADIDWVTVHPPYIVPFAKSIGYKIGIEERVSGEVGQIPYVDLAEALLEISSNITSFKHKKLHVTSTVPFVQEKGVNYYPHAPLLLYDAVKDKIVLNPPVIIPLVIVFVFFFSFIVNFFTLSKKSDKTKSN